MKKLFSVIMALVLVFSMTSFTVLASDGEPTEPVQEDFMKIDEAEAVPVRFIQI